MGRDVRIAPTNRFGDFGGKINVRACPVSCRLGSLPIGQTLVTFGHLGYR
ncbi:hypothetical protein Pan181_38120 [Aeoliella mucimassa]|uniref:Uncharacterized protein n=1 Tax=Aeoliella mucimassa TaxID=2527972 RepID=A0A518ASA2_9BACT|nr:hypothetical protein Pan181_38120 [Aeoliella mucimassa]